MTHNLAGLSPAYFGIVMATGIISLTAHFPTWTGTTLTIRFSHYPTWTGTTLNKGFKNREW